MITGELRFNQQGEATINIDEIGETAIYEFLWDSYSARVEHQEKGTHVLVLGLEVKNFFINHSPDYWCQNWGEFADRRSFLAVLIKVIEALASDIGQEIQVVYHGLEQADIEFYLKATLITDEKDSK